jgi:homoserine kinase
MIEVTFYKTLNGDITRIAVLDSEMIDLNLLDGEAWIEGHYDNKTKRIVGGSVVDIPQSELDAEEIKRAWANLKQDRKARLVASDWTQVPDAPVDREAWAVYRQQLRDLPKNTTDPRNPVWPTPPA